MLSKQIYGARHYSMEARLRVGLAVIELYARDEDDKKSIWKSHHNNYPEFFRQCMLGDRGFNPIHNKAQEQLADVPGETIELCVDIFDCDEPSHSITLVRGSDGILRLKKPTIRLISKPPTKGVLAVVTLHEDGSGRVSSWIPLS